MIIELHPGVPRFDRTLRIDDGDRTLVAVMDGSASWGMGEEAATAAQTCLRQRWASGVPTEVDLAVEARAAIASVPDDLKHDDFGWSFSLTLLLCEPAALSFVTAGFFAIRIFRPGLPSEDLHRPRTLADQIREIAEHADGYELPDGSDGIIVSAFAGDENPPPTTGRVALAPGDVVAVVERKCIDALELPPEVGSAKAVAGDTRAAVLVHVSSSTSRADTSSSA